MYKYLYLFLCSFPVVYFSNPAHVVACIVYTDLYIFDVTLWTTDDTILNWDNNIKLSIVNNGQHCE